MSLFITKSISRRLIFWLAIIIASIFLAFFVVFIGYDARSTENDLNEQADHLLSFSQHSLASAMWQYNHEYVQDYIDSLFLNKDIVFAQAAIDSQTRVTSAREGYKQIDHSKYYDSDEFVVRESIVEYKNDQVGSIFFVMSKERVAQQVFRNTLAASVLLLLVASVISVAMMFLFRRNVLAPLVRLDRSAQKIADGALDTTIDVSSDDEIGQLAKSFRHMMQSIRSITASRDELNQEIAERHKTEEELNKNQSLLDATGRMARVGGWELDAETKEASWTEETHRIHELPLHEKPSLQEAIEFYHPDDQDRLSKAVQSALDHGRGYDLEIRLITAKGNLVWVRTQCNPIKENNQVVKLIGTIQDITEQKRAESAIRESEELFRSIFEGSIDGIGFMNKDGIFVDANDSLLTMLGYTIDQLKGMSSFDVTPAKLHQHEKETILPQLLSAGRTDTYEKELIRQDGIILPVEITSYKYKDMVFSVVRDLTDKKKIERELIQSHKMEAIGTLAGGIAHDFNNILSSIIGFTELSLEDAEPGSDQEDSLEEVYLASNRAKDLVWQILTFARQIDEPKKPIQIASIIREVLKFIRSSIPTTIEIQTSIESDSKIIGNRTQVHQIIMNLCTNAAYSMEESGGILAISVKDVTINSGTELFKKGLDHGDYVEIRVTDTGTGISDEVLGSIFQPYFTTKPVGEGTGMGLAVVQGIVEKSNGWVSVESSVGQGSSFSVFLPITKKNKALHQFEQQVLPTGSERVLFVDDEAPIAKMGVRNLESLGYKVTARTSSVEALELFRAKPGEFDLVITDMTMPNMSGDVLAVELMKVRPDIPIIICTGYSKKITSESAQEIGIKALIYKPVLQADFAKTIRRVLDAVKV